MDVALAQPGPVIVEAVVDPMEPPMPPKVTAGQVKKFAQSLAKGQPQRVTITTTIAEDKIRELL